jgi:hypothetical protein
MMVGVMIVERSFLVMIVENVFGVLTTIGSTVATLASYIGAKLRDDFHPGSAISDPTSYSIELSCILLLISVGAVLAIV